jgi:phage repressor protein C with HTH and peptisase S24 domain
MEPRYQAGETVWINPTLPVRQGDDVVAQILGDDEDESGVESYIKQFVSMTAKGLRLKQLNPEDGESEFLEFPQAKVFSVHKVVFHATL